MKTNLNSYFLLLLALSAAHLAQAQGTAFTYQGRLSENGVPASGAYDLRFTIHDLAEGGNPMGGPLTESNVDVSKGLFTVTLDFGAGVLTGPARWLEIGVRTNGGDVFATLTPRQALASAPYSILAGSVANGTVTSDQLNTGGIAPAPGQFLSYDGGNLFWSDPGGLTGNIWSRNGATAYYNAGSVGLGTDSPETGIRLQVNGTTRLAPGGSGGYVQIGTPNGETGLGVIGDNRFDLRFDGSTLKLVAGLGLGPPSAQSGITIGTSGYVGVGTAHPLERFSVGGDSTADTKIEINAGGNAYAALRLRNSASSWLWQVTPSNDQPGGRLRLTDEFSGTEPVSITHAGDVGIGTTTPVAKLHAETPDPGKTAVYGVASSTSSVGVYGSANAASSVGVWGHNNAGLAVYADGNAGQARDKGGFVKAMAFIDPFLPADQYVVRCYNSQLAGNAASIAPCGITVTREIRGLYHVDFGFNVEDRFISVTARESWVRGAMVGSIDSVAGNRVTVAFHQITSDGSPPQDSRFYIIVY